LGKLKLATHFRTAEPGAGARTRLTKKNRANLGWHVPETLRAHPDLSATAETATERS
jgi:hypothetical protein